MKTCRTRNVNACSIASRGRLAASVAAGAAVAGAARRAGGAQAQVVEGAVQLAADLVEHLLAGDQIVCGHRRGHSQRLDTR